MLLKVALNTMTITSSCIGSCQVNFHSYLETLNINVVQYLKALGDFKYQCSSVSKGSSQTVTLLLDNSGLAEN